MPEKTNQERILSSLFESSKTTGELAKELGYTDPEGHGNYKIILRDLKILEENGFIAGKKVKLQKCGPSPTLYSIILNVQNFKFILKKYKNLIYIMQKNSLILERVLEANTDDTVPEKIKENLRKMLQSSPSFFKYLLFGDESELSQYIEYISDISKGEKHYELLVTQDEIYKVVLGINIVFRACVEKDLVEGNSSREAKEYIKEMINKSSEAVITIVLEHYTENKDIPNIRGKRIISAITPKLHKIFQQNLKNLNYYLQS